MGERGPKFSTQELHPVIQTMVTDLTRLLEEPKYLKEQIEEAAEYRQSIGITEHGGPDFKALQAQVFRGATVLRDILTVDMFHVNPASYILKGLKPERAKVLQKEAESLRRGPLLQTEPEIRVCAAWNAGKERDPDGEKPARVKIDQTCRQIIALQSTGLGRPQIARELGVSLRTVDRMLQIIRSNPDIFKNP